MKTINARQAWAIPNIFCYYRMLLIPEFIWLYVTERQVAALIILGLSALSDLLDGRAARRLGQITPLGRVLDPLADKLTQLAVIGCLSRQRRDMLLLLLLIVIKELGAAIAGLRLLRQGGVPFDSRWYGKLSTAGLYILCGLLLSGLLPHVLETLLIWAQLALTFTALVLYAAEFRRRAAELSAE